MGISPRRLLGWEPATVTTHAYDEQGRVCRSVTVTEAEFNQGDVDELLEHVAQVNAPRGRHGHLMAEAMDPANQFAYEPVGPHTDWAQKTIDDAKKLRQRQYPDADLSAEHWAVRLRARRPHPPSVGA